MLSVGITYTTELQYELPVIISNNVFHDSPVVNEVIFVTIEDSLKHPIIIENNTF